MLYSLIFSLITSLIEFSYFRFVFFYCQIGIVFYSALSIVFVKEELFADRLLMRYVKISAEISENISGIRIFAFFLTYLINQQVANNCLFTKKVR